MANHLAVHSVTQALNDYLEHRYATYVPTAELPPLPSARFDVLSSATFNSQETPDAESGSLVSIYLHRVSINNQLRNTRAGPPVGPLGLDLHYLLTVWAAQAAAEHILLAWAMQELHYHAFLDRSTLNNEAGWAVDEQINLVPAEMPADEMSRIWETGNRGYRLSYPFIARIVRIFPGHAGDGAPVVAKRFTYTDELENLAR